jgi:uncharacterized protein (DUF885 family)
VDTEASSTLWKRQGGCYVTDFPTDEMLMSEYHAVPHLGAHHPGVGGHCAQMAAEQRQRFPEKRQYRQLGQSPHGEDAPQREGKK